MSSIVLSTRILFIDFQKISELKTSNNSITFHSWEGLFSLKVVIPVCSQENQFLSHNHFMHVKMLVLKFTEFIYIF